MEFFYFFISIYRISKLSVYVCINRKKLGTAGVFEYTRNKKQAYTKCVCVYLYILSSKNKKISGNVLLPRKEKKQMTYKEYESIQYALSALLGKMQYKQLTGKRAEGYKQAVLACKSVLSNYNPFPKKK